MLLSLRLRVIVVLLERQLRLDLIVVVLVGRRGRWLLLLRRRRRRLLLLLPPWWQRVWRRHILWTRVDERVVIEIAQPEPHTGIASPVFSLLGGRETVEPGRHIK